MIMSEDKGHEDKRRKRMETRMMKMVLMKMMQRRIEKTVIKSYLLDIYYDPGILFLLLFSFSRITFLKEGTESQVTQGRLAL